VVDARHVYTRLLAIAQHLHREWPHDLGPPIVGPAHAARASPHNWDTLIFSLMFILIISMDGNGECVAE
jgi:hypothetical protein